MRCRCECSRSVHVCGSRTFRVLVANLAEARLLLLVQARPHALEALLVQLPVALLAFLEQCHEHCEPRLLQPAREGRD